MTTKAKRKTTNALEIIDNRYFNGRPEMEALLAEAEQRLRLAERLREMREQQKLSQEELAKRAGKKRSVIARLEKPGYQKHTLTTLKKVAGAMGYMVKVEFVPVQDARKHSARQTALRQTSTGQVVKKTGAAKTAAKK